MTLAPEKTAGNWKRLITVEAEQLITVPRTQDDRASIIAHAIVPHQGNALVLDQCELLATWDLRDSDRSRIGMDVVALPIVVHGHFTFPEHPYCDGHFPDTLLVPGHWKAEFGFVAGAYLIGKLPCLNGLTAVRDGNLELNESGILPPGIPASVYTWVTNFHLEELDGILRGCGTAQAYVYAHETRLLTMSYGFSLIPKEEVQRGVDIQIRRFKQRQERLARRASSGQ